MIVILAIGDHDRIENLLLLLFNHFEIAVGQGHCSVINAMWPKSSLYSRGFTH